MNNKSFISYMNNTTDAITRMKGSTCSRVVFYSAMIVAMFNFLENIEKNKINIYGKKICFNFNIKDENRSVKYLITRLLLVFVLTL